MGGLEVYPNLTYMSAYRDAQRHSSSGVIRSWTTIFFMGCMLYYGVQRRMVCSVPPHTLKESAVSYGLWSVSVSFTTQSENLNNR